MSRSYEYSYALERARRQAIYNQRVSTTTEQFYKRYVNQYEQMIKQGFSSYIPDEMSRLKNDLSQIRDLLISNPTEARDISFEVGSYINGLNSMAHAAVEEFDLTMRMRREKIRQQEKEIKNSLLDEYFKLLREISNPIVINYAQSDLETLKNTIESGSNRISTVDELKRMVSSIIKSAENKADEWKKSTMSNQKNKVFVKRLEEVETTILQENIEDKKKTTEFVDTIQKLKESILTGNITDKEAERKLSEIKVSVDDTMITEEIRRETVKAIVKQLRNQEFNIKQPQIIQNGDESYVKIIAQKPSGKRAICKIDLYGKIAYKFDNYQGMTCLKDIEKFNIDLQEIYSVKLSDERVLWSNPDKLSKDAENLPKNNGRYL